jgi:hypothetical protein
MSKSMMGLDSTPPVNTDAADGFADRPTPDEQRRIDTLYDGNRADTTVDATGFYGFSTVTSAINGRASDLSVATGATEADIARVRSDFVELAKKSELPEGFVATLAHEHINAQIADARIVEDADAEAHTMAKQIAAWNAETRERLQMRYGPKDAEQLLARAQKFVAAHPTLKTVLQRRGLGSRPEIVEQIIAHVFSKGLR